MVRLLAVLLCIVSTWAPAWGAFDEAPSQLGFGYCSPPVVPSCIDADPSIRAAKSKESCSRDVLRFTQTLGAYRLCLARESARAIGSGNDAIARFRCRSQGGTVCR